MSTRITDRDHDTIRTAIVTGFDPRGAELIWSGAHPRRTIRMYLDDRRNADIECTCDDAGTVRYLATIGDESRVIDGVGT